METATEIKVRYSETDAMGVVYHANYLLYLEVARTEFLEKLGFPYKSMEDAGFMSPVLSCNLEYGQSFGYGDTVVVYTSVSKVTAVKTEYYYRIFAKGDDPTRDKPRFTGTTLHCLVRSSDFKPVSQKKTFPELFAAYKEALEPRGE